MKQQNQNRNCIPLDDANRIVGAVEFLAGIGISDITTRIASSLKIQAAIAEHDAYDVDSLYKEAYNERLVLELLTLIGEIEAKNNGLLWFPDIQGGGLSLAEIATVERQRIVERSVELRGDKKDMANHRENLRRMLEAAPKSKEIRKTWEVLDASLEADIMYVDSLTNIEES